MSIIFLSVLSHPLILVISCLGNEGLYWSVAMLLNREPFVSDSGDCQRICGGEKGSQLVSGNSWIVKGVIFCGVSATDWKVNTCTTNEEIIFRCHDNTQKMQATPKPSKRNAVLLKLCFQGCFLHTVVLQ